MVSSRILILSLFAMFLAACGEPADTRPGQPVKHRRDAFANILKAFEPMGQQLRKQQYDPDLFLSHAKALAQAKDGPWQYFGPDTNYPPTHATARVWSEPDHFQQEQRAFLAATERLLAAAESRDPKAVNAAYEAVHEQCRSCHKVFKE